MEKDRQASVLAADTVNLGAGTEDDKSPTTSPQRRFVTGLCKTASYRNSLTYLLYLLT